MVNRKFLVLLCFVIFSTFVYPLLLHAEQPGKNILFIFDSSESMNQESGGKSKRDSAKEVLSSLVEELPAELGVGLMVYGHKGNRDCSAIEVLVPPENSDKDLVKTKVSELGPSRGATPIADSLATAGEALKPLKGEKAIVLISNGEETCGGNPVETASRLKKDIAGLTIYVVGFGVGEKERKQLEGIASSGGSVYYQAQDATALAESLKKIKAQVAVAKAKAKVLVKDDFNEDYLSENWELKNPNPDTIIVEEGFLQILTDLPKDNLFEPTNLVLLNRDLPKQWEAILRLHFTGFDSYVSWYMNQVAGLMLYRDKNNGIMLAMSTQCCDIIDAVHFEKVRQGKWVPGFTVEFGKAKEGREVVLRLQRIKRKFIASFLNEKGKWQTIGEFTELSPKYKLGIFALRGDGRAHEALEKFDSFELKEIK